ncbi:hypothetical protein BGX27_003537 [Mortierella sp. AM989]|nr:hypothetical protein BGX27_003537 [Mortierella sp. AM989]
MEKVVYKAPNAPGQHMPDLFVLAEPGMTTKYRESKTPPDPLYAKKFEEIRDSIPLVDVVQSYDIFQTVTGKGFEGKIARPSKSDLNAIFNTDNVQEIVEHIILHGTHMNLSPTSRTLFMVQLGTFFSGVIVIVCCCLYLSAYPKSPDDGSVSAIACATLALALVSTIITLVLVLRQKSGRTVSTNIEGCWVGLAAILWILAAVGGIAKPANDMKNVTCKVLPSGKDTDDKNYIRACQSMFASTAFCILSALFFIATAVILIIFSIQKSIRDKKAAKVKVGGSYQLGPSPSQYRRAEQSGEIPTEESKDVEATSPSTDPATTVPGTSMLTPATVTTTSGGNFSNNVYQDPVISTPAPVATPPAAVIPQTSGTPSPYNTYSSGGHVHQASYQSTPGGYNTALNSNTYNGNNGGGFGQGTGHIPQGSTNSGSNYDHYHPNPYANSGNAYPPQQQGTYPPQQQGIYPPQQQGAYPIMGPPNQQSPYGTQYVSPQQQEQRTPVMEMPRPEHF